MIIHIHREFKKRFKSLHSSIQDAFSMRRDLFISNQIHPLLNNHPLKGKWEGWRSINVTGDFRVIFRELKKKEYLFYLIGTHSELWGK